MRQAAQRSPPYRGARLIAAGPIGEFVDAWGSLVNALVKSVDANRQRTWSVLLACSLSSTDTHGLSQMTKFALGSAGIDPSRYDVRCSIDEVNNPTCYSIMSIPGVGALWTIPADSGGEFGVWLKEGLPSAAHCELETRLSVGTSRVLDTSVASLDPEEIQRFSKALVEFDSHPSAFFLRYPDPAYFFFPKDSFRPGSDLAKRESERIGEADITQFLVDLATRRDTFERQRVEYEFRQILSLRAVERWIVRGDGVREPRPWSIAERIGVLSNVLRLLEAYPRKIRLALADDQEWLAFDNSKPESLELDWAVKRNHAVAAISFPPGSDQKKLATRGAILRLPILAKVAEKDFHRIWSRLGRSSRNPRDVFTWFEARLEDLRRRHDKT